MVCAYAVWLAIFHKNAKILLLSQGELEAFDLISKCKFVVRNLPDFIKTPLDPDQRGHIGFPVTGSEIRALPSTERAGRSTDATLVICDEWERHPFAEENFASLKPTIGAGGQFIGLSTANKLETDTFFKELYIRAKSGDSEFHPIFLSWKERPVRQEGLTLDEWFARETRDMADWQVEQEYPEKEEDALKTLKTRAFFDLDKLDALYDYTPLIEHELSKKYKGLVKIYRLPVVGRKYCQFTDPSDGRDDPHATIVVDVVTGEEVAESHGKVTADICALIHNDLVREYNDAFNSYELNARAGGIFSEKMKDLDTPNQAPFLKTDGTFDTKNPDKKGWWTSERLKNKFIWGLEEAVRLLQFRIHSEECKDEMSKYIIPEGDKPQPTRGAHDDYIMAWGGVLELKKYVPTGKMTMTSFRMRESNY